VTLTFDLEVGVGVACDLGYPCAKFRLPTPFGFRVRADVRDIRQTDADDRLMPPLTGRGHNKCIEDDTKAATRQSPNCIKKTKIIKYSKKDFQYGGWNSYTLQFGTIMTLISPGD